MHIHHKFIGFNIQLERHGVDCNCAYCVGQHKLHYGLNIPKRWKEWNSWYVIKLWGRIYLRWTNHWLKCFRSKK